MKLRGFDVTKAQHGWVSDCYYRVTTANQFTDEELVVRSGGRWLWLALIRSYRKAKRAAKSVRAAPGERESKGWAA